MVNIIFKRIDTGIMIPNKKNYTNRVIKNKYRNDHFIPTYQSKDYFCKSYKFHSSTLDVGY